jgi:hypothetical protein
LFPFTIIEHFFFAAFFIALMKEAANIVQTSVNFYQTARRSIAEDIHFLHLEVSFQKYGNSSVLCLAHHILTCLINLTALLEE